MNANSIDRISRILRFSKHVWSNRGSCLSARPKVCLTELLLKLLYNWKCYTNHVSRVDPYLYQVIFMCGESTSTELDDTYLRLTLFCLSYQEKVVMSWFISTRNMNCLLFNDCPYIHNNTNVLFFILYTRLCWTVLWSSLLRIRNFEFWRMRSDL